MIVVKCLLADKKETVAFLNTGINNNNLRTGFRFESEIFIEHVRSERIR